MNETIPQHFTGTVWRPPYEAYSVLLQATVSCTHHACKFCSLYGSLRFRMASRAELESDLQLIASYQPRARRVFLVGANPFALSAGRLIRLADLIRDYLPRTATIGMFARIADVLRKSPGELRELRARGITGISIGTETGDGPTLEFMNKGCTPDDILEACRRLDEAHIEYYFTYMTGLAGAGNGLRAARNTVQLFNRLHPYVLSVVSLTLFEDVPLAADVAAGRFVPMPERERLEELRCLVAGLEGPLTLLADTVSNPVPLCGRLPEDRGRMLGELDAALAAADEAALSEYRRGIVHL